MRLEPAELLLLGVLLLPGLLSIGLCVWSLVDAIQVPQDSHYRSGSRIIWVLVILLLPVVGPIIYFAAGRPSRRR